VTTPGSATRKMASGADRIWILHPGAPGGVGILLVFRPPI
jgi:hypothetical protein